MDVRAYAAPAAKAPLEPFVVPRRDVGPDDVAIDIKFAGICHSDIHQAREEWFSAPSSRWSPGTRSPASSRQSAPT